MKRVPRRLAILLSLSVVSACSGQPGAPSSISGGNAPGSGSSAATEVFVGAGDIGRCGSVWAEETAKLLDRQPGTIFALGDNAYPRGSEDDYRECYAPSWGRHRSRTRPVPGNHEYETAGAAGYFAYFGAHAGAPDRGYYAFTLGAWRIFALNSEVPASAGSAQAAWLRAELASAPSACTAAYWHRPLVSSGLHGDNPDMRELFRILYDAGAEFVLSGHDHMYERFGRLDPNGRPDPRGTRQFVVGTGGTPLSDHLRVRLGSEAQGASFGVLRFDLSPGSYRWQFLSVGGESFQDSGVDACH